MEAEKIEAIKSYLSNNGVKYYDIQTELIDHFATAVENVQRINPKIGFQEALLVSHREFGGKEGFRKYVLEAESNVTKKTWLLVGKTLLQFLKWPCLMVVGLLTLFWTIIIDQWQAKAEWFFVGIMISFLIVMLINNIKLQKIEMFLPRKTNKALGWVLYFVAFIPGFIARIPFESITPIYTTAYFTFLSLVCISFYQVPSLAINETKKLYPQIA